ncbi:hypothetical protein P7K49_003635, partial [Saguinus oedipus]
NDCKFPLNIPTALRRPRFRLRRPRLAGRSGASELPRGACSPVRPRAERLLGACGRSPRPSAAPAR